MASSLSSSVDTVRLGLVGCGRIAQLIHLPVLARLPGARLIAVADPDADRRAAAVSHVPTATPYADYRRLLEEPDLDAVVVCAPTGLHAEIAEAAFSTGRGVYLEKPVAVTLEEGERLAEAWRESGAVGMTGFAFRFSPRYREARDLLRQGRLGPLAGAQTLMASAPRALPAWKQDRALGGGVLLDLASHHADLARFLFEEDVVEVTARVRSLRSAGDTAAIQMTMASGLPVQSTFSLAAAEAHRFEVLGEGGRLTVDPWHRPSVPVTSGAAPSRVDRVREMLDPQRVLHRPDYHAPFRAALAAFAEAVRSGRTVAPDIEDGLHSLAVVEAAERSVQSGHAEAVQNPQVRAPERHEA